jgi:hypothetical protein
MCFVLLQAMGTAVRLRALRPAPRPKGLAPLETPLGPNAPNPRR